MNLTKTDDRTWGGWMIAILAILPGLLITIATLLNLVYEMAFWVALALILFVTIGWFYQSKQLPTWSLMAVGMLLTAALVIVSGVFGGITTLIVGSAGLSLSVAIAIAWLAIVLIVLHFWSHKQISFSPTIWLVMASIIICNLLVRMKYFYLFDLSWPVVGEVTKITLWSTATLLLPVILGMYLARRFGMITVLFAVGATFMWFQIIVDNAGKVSENVQDPLLLGAYLLLTPVLATIIGPIFYLRAKNTTYRLPGLLVATGIAVAANVIISGIARGDFTLFVWLSAIPYTVSVVMVLWLSFLLYRAIFEANEAGMVSRQIKTL